MQARVWVLTMGTWLSLSACGATNTGNPVADNSPADGPKGIEYVHSSLSRSTEPDLDAGVDQTLGADSRGFAFDLYQQVINGRDNTFFSPYSITMAMAMTYAGADGQTKQEMRDTLHFSLPEAELHAALNAAEQTLVGRQNEVPASETGEPGGDLEISLLNAAFLRKGMEFKQPYLDTLAINYGAGMYLADFAAQPEHERMAINDWVAERTHDRIIDLLPPMSLDTDTFFVLVNTIYFKASWMMQFSKDLTADGVFHTLDGDANVPMMHANRDDLYYQGDGYQALELPYIVRDMRMLFILPDAGRYAEIEGLLDSNLFNDTVENLATYTVDTQIPKFSFKSKFDLKNALQALGTVQLFNSTTCDLTRMTDISGVFVDQVYHQAFVAVDEEGTEASAATALVGGLSSKPPPAQFTIDRPFIFAIYDEPTGQILFLGRVMDPSKG